VTELIKYLQVIETHQMGKPLFVHLRRNRGAWPAHARPYRVRDDAYRSELPAEKAETKITALMIEGSALILAFWMAMTKGEDAAVDAPKSRESLYGTSHPMTTTPPT
jgi:hypothetical protein